MKDDKLTREPRTRQGSISSRDVKRTSGDRNIAASDVSTRPSLAPGWRFGTSLVWSACGFAAGVAAGATAMYLLDPDRGRRRRALAKDRLARATHEVSAGVRSTVSDVRNRTKGLAHEVSRKVAPGDEVDDTTLKARVRSVLGHAIDHPHSIVVSCDGGRVTLAGPVLRSELDGLLSTVRKVPGVRSARDLLERHDSAEGVPSLQALSDESKEADEAEAVTH